MSRVATSRTRVDRDRADRPGRASVARPDQQTGKGDRHEHDDEPAQPGAPRGRHVQTRPHRLDRGDPGGPAGRFEGGCQRDEDPDGDGGRRIEERQLRALERHRADRAEVRDHRRREQRTEQDPDRRTDEPDGERLGQDERADLDAGRPGGPQQPDLAEPLDDRHRERVEDQERAGEQGDRGDHRGRGLEVGGGGPQRVGEVLGRRNDIRFDQQTVLRGRP